jgi:hypothetical protein
MARDDPPTDIPVGPPPDLPRRPEDTASNEIERDETGALLSRRGSTLRDEQEAAWIGSWLALEGCGCVSGCFAAVLLALASAGVAVAFAVLGSR